MLHDSLGFVVHLKLLKPAKYKIHKPTMSALWLDSKLIVFAVEYRPDP